MRFRPDTNDEEIWQSVTAGNEYGLPATFRSADVVLDIGAHIGAFAYEALCRGAGKVVAFEADRENYHLASENLAQFGDRVSLTRGAVSRSDIAIESMFFGGYERWPDRWNTGGGSVLWATEGQEVLAVPFDRIIDQVTLGRRQPVRLVKLDCEESEWPILFTSHRLQLIEEIIGEYHEIGGQFDGRPIPPQAAVGHYSRFTRAELEQFLTAQGFDTQIVGSSRLGKFVAKRRSVEISAGQSDVAFVPREQIRVYAEVLPPALGFVIHRINREIKRHAPPQIQFVSEPGLADLQVLDVLGTGSPPYLGCRNFAIVQHCYNTSESRDPIYWLALFRRALVVMSYLDLIALTGDSRFSFYHAPFGVDGAVFFDRKLDRRFAIMTSGHVLGQEAIGECHDALFGTLRGVRGGMVHLGPSFWQHPGFEAHSNISDDQLACLYSQCKYVAGLRRGEGFELPVLEGLACGARPVCFDTPGYRYWFGDHAVYVPEVSADELVHELARVLAEDPVPVSVEERKIIIERFDWAKIMGGFWQRVLEQTLGRDEHSESVAVWRSEVHYESQ